LYVEDTGEEPKCVICGSPEECEHLVADIDHTFLESWGGAFHDREYEFRSEIETVFLKLLKSGTAKKWQHSDIEQMWDQANTDYTAETDDLMLDGYAFYRLIVELLEAAGAIDHPGSIVDDGGGPGRTSSVSLLYADNPNVVTDKALKNLNSVLAQ
jgi:hypothetical protein